MSISIITTSMLLLTTLSTPDMKLCEDWNECQGQTIDTSIIDCLSYISCQKTTISAKGGKAEINCFGSHSCYESISLISSELIHCAGHKSCASTGNSENREIAMQADKIQCSGSYSCACDKVAKYSLKAGDISCGGFKSCDQCKMSSGGSTMCDGSNSCSSSKIESAQGVGCSGSKSCSQTKLITLSNIKCSGEGSCKKSNIEASTLKCDGIKSCDNAIISASTIIADGYESLKGSKIDSTGIDNMNVILSGEAALFGTSIICRDESNCNIKCTDECSELEVIIMNNAVAITTITTTKEDAITGEPIEIIIICENTNTNVGCPKILESNEVCLDEFFIQYFSDKKEKNRLKILSDLKYEIEDDYEYDYDEIDYDYDLDIIRQYINTNPGTEACINYGDCRGAVLTEVHQECYGFESCESAIIKQIDIQNGGEHGTEQLGYIECFGDSSCLKSSIYTQIGTVLCDGHLSCSNTTKFHGKMIHCNGLNSCSFAAANNGGINGHMIFCDGRTSCINNIMTSIKSTMCRAKYSCFNSQITAGGKIICNGRQACKDSQLISDVVIRCLAFNSCYNAQMEATNKIYIDGEEGAARSIIKNTPLIIASGYKSIENGLIDSQNVIDLFIKLKGDLSGQNAQIICRVGSNCELKCTGNACKDTQFICEQGAKCIVKPRKCGRKRAPIMIKGIYCPIVTKNVPPSNNQLYADVLLNNNNQLSPVALLLMVILIGAMVIMIARYLLCRDNDDDVKYQYI